MASRVNRGSSVRLASAVGVLGLLASTSLADTWIVAQDGSGDFTSLASAVAQSSEGDVLFLRTGNYPGARIQGKSLEVVAQPGSVVEVVGLEISELDETQHVLLAGFAVAAPEASGQVGTALELRDCAGSITLQDLSAGLGGQSARVAHCANVAIANCSFKAGFSDWQDMEGAAFGIQRSKVSLHSSSIRGSTGSPGVACNDSTLFLSDSTVTGGHGSGCHWDCQCVEAGDGGPGCLALGSSRIVVQSSSVLGGNGGTVYGDFGCFDIGDYGASFVLNGEARVQTIAGASRTIEVDSAVYAGGVVCLRYKGAAGDQLQLLDASMHEFELNLGLGGVQLVDRDSSVTRLGTADADGELSLEVPVADFPGASGVGSRVLQFLIEDSTGELYLARSLRQAFLEDPTFLLCARTIYVDQNAPAGGSGATWGSAMNDLQDALREAESRYDDCGVVSEVWMTEGTYRVTPRLSERAMPFSIRTPFKLRGGFSGRERSPEERDLSRHKTLISADALGDDGLIGGGSEDNAASALHCDFGFHSEIEPLVLDGLVIEAARGSSGFVLRNQQKTLMASLLSCTFQDNQAAIEGAGASLECYRAELNHCAFLDNSSTGGVAGLALDVKQAAIAHSRFEGNFTSVHEPSAIEASQIDQFSISNSVFLRNHTTSDGALYIRSNLGTVRVSSCTFYENTSLIGAACITGFAQSPIEVRNSIFWANRSGTESGDRVQFDVWGDSLHFQSSCVQGWSGQLDGEFIIDENPRLNHDGSLNSGSVVIDYGQNLALEADLFDLDQDGDLNEPIPFDLAGNPRVFNDPTVLGPGEGVAGNVDMGAFEFIP